MANEIRCNVSDLSPITYVNLINRIIEVDKQLDKRLSFNPETREIDSLIGLTLETTKSIFADEYKHPKNKEETLGTMMAQSKELLEMMGIDVEKRPRKVTSNFNNLSEEESAIKLLAQYLEETVCADIKNSNTEVFVPYSRYAKAKNETTYFRKNNLNFDMLSDYGDSMFKLSKMEYSDSPAYNKANVLRQDTCIVEASTKDMDINILKSLNNYYLDVYDFLPENERSIIMSQLREQPVLLEKLKSYIDTMRVGYIKRTISYLYLDFYRKYFKNLKYKQLDETKLGYKLFDAYVSRFDEFEKLMKEILITNNFDTYLFDYNGEESGFDLIHSLRDSSAYGCLPFIGVISEAISDLTNDSRDLIQELYGISSKLNGIVSSEGVKSFDSYLVDLERVYTNQKELKSSDDKKGQEIARALILKFFVVGLDDPNYNPIEVFLQDVRELPESLSNKSGIKLSIKKLCEDINRDKFKIDKNLECIKKLLQKGFNEKKPFSYEYTRQLAIFKSMLPEDLGKPDGQDGKDFNIMHVDRYDTRLVRYTTMFEDIEELMSEVLYSFEYTFKFDTMMMQSCSNVPQDTCRIEYDPSIIKKGYGTSFILYPSFTKKTSEKKYTEVENIKVGIHDTIKNKGVSAILIPYWDLDAMLENQKTAITLFGGAYHCGSFKLVYDLVYSIIVNTLVNTICKTSHKRQEGSDINKERALRKFNIINIQTLYRSKISKEEHEKIYQSKKSVFTAEYSDSQTFIRSLSKCLENSLHSIYTCQSQGYDVGTKANESNYKAGNANKSLNINMPKKFKGINGTPKYLTKCAVIVATSVKIDEGPQKHLGGECTEAYKSLINGEVILFNNNDLNELSIFNVEKYDAIVDHKIIHSSPEIFNDIVARYYERGYKDFIFVAKAPYTTKTLDRPDDTNMYFMNDSIIQSMESVGEDVNIYPIYINYMKTFQCNPNNNNSVMYMSDTEHISNNLFKKHKGIYPLLQLSIQNPVDRSNINNRNHYSTIAIYSTLVDMHLSDRVRKCTYKMCNDNDFRLELLNILLALHANKYEKHSKEANIKKDPYEKVMGNKSVGRKSTFNYSLKPFKEYFSTLQINYLALSSIIKNALNRI